MKKLFLISTLISVLLITNGVSQNVQDTKVIVNSKELKGLVLDKDKLTALPYANIYVLHKNKGVISNETGNF